MKILFVGRKFGGVAGGLERISIMLMNALVARSHQIGLITLDAADAETHYPLDPAVDWHKLAIGDPLHKANWGERIARQGRMRALAKENAPQVILAFEHGTFLAVRLATLGLGIPVLAAERNAPQRFDYQPARYYQGLIFLSLLLAKRIAVQFESYRTHYPAYLRGRMVAIPNPVLRAGKTVGKGRGNAERKVLLFVGHLAYQKNPEVLVRAFGMLAGEFPDWELQMAGAGEYRASLEKLTNKLGIADRVRFLGIVQDVAALYVQSHLFCLPSLWEGFPNALAEAFAHGLPAVGFAQCAGLNELIEDGKNGVLAAGNADPDSLAAALQELMGAPQLREQMGQAAIESVVRYQPDEIFDHWEALLQETIGKQRA